MSHENAAEPSPEMVERVARALFATEEPDRNDWRWNRPNPNAPDDPLGWHEYWFTAARAALTAALSGTTTEWGVRWPDGSVSTLDEDLDEFSEASAREYVADGCATLVSREVTEWREVGA